jgi:hypothetical protein
MSYIFDDMIRIPGTELSLRIFDRVETTDSQYDVFDVGIQHKDGGIDSLAVGGSFHTAKRCIDNMNSNADKQSDEKTTD